MKNFSMLMASALATIVGALTVGCAEKEFPARRAFLFGPTEKHFSVGDYGDIPALNATSETFEPLVGKGGRLTQGTVTEAAKFIADSTKNLTCDLKAGDSILVVGRKGDFFLVDLSKPCVIEGKEYNEGYVKSAAVEIKVLLGASSESVSVAKTPAAQQVALPSTATVQTAENDLGCTRIAQTVIREGAAKVDHSRDMYSAKEDKTDDSGCWNAPMSVFIGGGACAIPGNLFRRGGITQDGHDLGIVVEGDALRFRIVAEFAGEKLNEVQLSAADFKKGEKSFVIPMKAFLPVNNKYGIAGIPGRFVVTFLNDKGESVGGTCEHNFRVVSPIVLDFSGLGRFDGISAAESNIRFDLLDNGESLQTGWLKPTMGLLAFDRNGNGRIDHGGELFGEATRLANGLTASNGYEALAALDTNRDGVIDSSDKLFKRLVVWLDANSDGVSQAQEIHTLASLEITKLGLSYSPSLRHGSASLFNNDVRFESRYWGPETCGAKGCMSFDVYFSTVSSVARR